MPVMFKSSSTLLSGLYALIYGFFQITAGIQIRDLGDDVKSLSELRHAA
jgi:hypothetical protein